MSEEMTSKSKVRDSIWFYKLIISTMIGILVTGALSWFTFGANGFVDEDEVRILIETNAPYVEDKKLISNSIKELAETQKHISKTQVVTQSQISVLTQQVGILSKNIERVLFNDK